MDYKEFEKRAQNLFEQQVKLFIYKRNFGNPEEQFKFILCQKVDGSFEFVSSPAYKDEAELASIEILVNGMNSLSIYQEEAMSDELIQLLRDFSQQTTEQMIGRKPETFYN